MQGDGQKSRKISKQGIISICAAVIFAAVSFVAIELYGEELGNHTLFSFKFDDQSGENANSTTPGDKLTEDTIPQQNLDNVLEAMESSQSEEIPESSSDTGNEETTPVVNYPEAPSECTKSGDDLLVLVNKQFQLPSTYEPSDLEIVDDFGLRATTGGLYVRSIIGQDLQEMIQAAGSQGFDLAAISAYRSYDTQVTTYNYWVAQLGQEEADRISARPGHSQHQLGTTIDFTSSEIGDQLGVQFADSWAGRWLADNSWKYGFAQSYPEGQEGVTGYSYEPWHYRYIGKANAEEMYHSGEILEVWLEGKN